MTDLIAAAGVAPALLTETGAIGGGEVVLFWILAPLMVLAALGLLFVRRAVHAAFMVIIVMISLAFIYTAQEAPFLGVAQVVVYTGAVMMLFLFVLMLVGVDASDSLVETLKGQRWIGYLLRSEEHTSELQSRGHLVCRLLLEKKKKAQHTYD